MISIEFFYKGKKTKIKCNEFEYISDILKNFASNIKANYDKLIFIYNDTRMNKDLDLTVEAQFELNENPKKTIKILVFNDISDEDECFVRFSYNSKEKIIKCNKNEKINVIWNKYASKAKVDISKLFFLYNGEKVTENDLENKTFYQLANKIDKESKIMNVIVDDYKKKDSITSVSLNKINEPFNNDPILTLSDNLIDNGNSINHVNEIDTETKNYYQKFFFILIVQYSLINFLVWLGFFFNINEIFTNNNHIMKWIFISIISFLFILSIIYYILLNKYKKNAFSYIYHIFYGLFIIICSNYLSKYFDKNNILCTLYLILIEIIAMEIYCSIFNNFKLYLIGLSSFLFSSISIIGFYFWIKDIIVISIIYSIGLSFIIYLIGMMVIISKLSQKDEYIFASIIFNYSIIFALSFGIITIITSFIKYLANFKSLYNENVFSVIKMYFILILQYILIIIIIYLGFIFEFNKYIISNNKAMIWIFSVTSFIILVASLILVIALYNHSDKTPKKWNLYHFIYFFAIILYLFLLSKFVEPNNILCLLFIYFLDLLVLEIIVLIFKTDSYSIFLSILIINIISVILFHFLWIKNNTSLICISIIASAFVLYQIICFFFVKDQYEKDEYNGGAIFINYGIFCLVIHVIWFILSLPGYFFYFIFNCFGLCE